MSCCGGQPLYIDTAPGAVRIGQPLVFVQALSAHDGLARSGEAFAAAGPKWPQAYHTLRTISG